jgi:hypothetical protein
MGEGLAVFFVGAFCGCLFGLFFIVILLRWGLRNLNLLTALVREVYHVDLLPFICRIEGLLNLVLIELPINISHGVMYLEMALKEIRKLKAQVSAAVKKYEGYGNEGTEGQGESRIKRWFRNLSL